MEVARDPFGYASLKQMRFGDAPVGWRVET